MIMISTSTLSRFFRFWGLAAAPFARHTEGPRSQAHVPLGQPEEAGSSAMLPHDPIFSKEVLHQLLPRLHCNLGASSAAAASELQSRCRHQQCH